MLRRRSSRSVERSGRPSAGLPSHLTVAPFIDHVGRPSPLLRYLEKQPHRSDGGIVRLRCFNRGPFLARVYAISPLPCFPWAPCLPFRITIPVTRCSPASWFPATCCFVIFRHIGQVQGIKPVRSPGTGLISPLMPFTAPFSRKKAWDAAAYLDHDPAWNSINGRGWTAAARWGLPPGWFIPGRPNPRPTVRPLLGLAFMTAWSEMLFASVLTTALDPETLGRGACRATPPPNQG